MMFGINFGYAKEPDNYYFNNKNKFELIFFCNDKEIGFFIALTNKKKKFVDLYDYKNDKIMLELGYQRVAKKYVFKKQPPFIYNKSLIIKNFK